MKIHQFAIAFLVANVMGGFGGVAVASSQADNMVALAEDTGGGSFDENAIVMVRSILFLLRPYDVSMLLL